MRAALRLLLVPLWFYWWLGQVLLWIIGNIYRWYRRQPEVRARALRRHHSRNARGWAEIERQEAAALRRRGLIDTPENRAQIRGRRA